ncbi:MAG: hypothetical protein ACI8PZ_002560 [Myxococcota bacterium]
MEWLFEPVACAEPARRIERRYDHTDLPAASVPEVFGVQAGGLVVANLDDDPAFEIVRTTDTVVQLYDQGADGEWRWAPDALPALGPRVWNAASAADMDGDHDLDLVLGGFDAPKVLLRNDGAAGFVDVTAESGLDLSPVRSAGMAWADWNRDGVLDLAVANYGGPPVGPAAAHPSELYLGRGDGTFTDVSHLLPHSLSESYTFLFAFFDLDHDGWPELLASNDFPDVNPSVVLLNQASSFSPALGTGFAAGLDAMGVAAADLNDDGVPDFLVSSINEFGMYWSVPVPDAPGGVVYVNRAPELGLTHRPSTFGWGVQFGDLDNDADEDLYLTFGDWKQLIDVYGVVVPHPDKVWEQVDPDTWEDRAAAWGLFDDRTGRGLALADIDRDGWLDPVVYTMEGATVVHRARCGEAGWLTVRLRDEATANTRGIGAVVDVFVDGRRQRRWVTAGSTSMFTGQDPEIHVGLGDADMVDRVEVRWPDGEVSVREAFGSRQRLTIVRRGR